MLGKNNNHKTVEGTKELRIVLETNHISTYNLRCWPTPAVWYF